MLPRTKIRGLGGYKRDNGYMFKRWHPDTVKIPKPIPPSWSNLGTFISEGISQRSEEYTSVEVVKGLNSIKTKQRRKEAIYTSTRSQATGTRGYAT
jgi:hypothetical protein